MKVCLVGDFSQNLDEGLKSTAHNLFNNLSNVSEIELYKLNLKKFSYHKDLDSLKDFSPDILHYIPGPTNFSLIFLKILISKLKHRPKIVLSALHPNFNDFLIKLLRLKIFFVISQSKELQNRLTSLKINSELIPLGVNINKFYPVNDKKKEILRRKYGIDTDQFIILHVGHIFNNRNLSILKYISSENQVVVVESPYLSSSKILRSRLKEWGWKIFTGYFENIEEFYQIADCYVFPVLPGNSILCPLSVLEAMACNLPVVTTKFEGLYTFFEENEGLFFSNPTPDDFSKRILEIKRTKFTTKTRNMVSGYSWENVAKKIIEIYFREE